MSIAHLPTNFIDDVIDTSVNEHRRYKLTETGEEGTYTFEDKTTYIQQGTTFNSNVANTICGTVNQLIELSENNDSDIDDIIDGTIPISYSARATTADSVDNDFILINQQSLIFVNKVCTLLDARITSDSIADVYFTDTTVESAKTSNIEVETSNGSVTLTATTTPSTTLIATIRIRVI